jgi:hypothetical protein
MHQADHVNSAVDYVNQVILGPNPAPIFSGYYNSQYPLNIAECTNRTGKCLMTKTELAEVIANNTGLPKAQTYKAL